MLFCCAFGLIIICDTRLTSYNPFISVELKNADFMYNSIFHISNKTFISDLLSFVRFKFYFYVKRSYIFIVLFLKFHNALNIICLFLHCTFNYTKFACAFFASAFSLVVKLYDVRNPWVGPPGTPTIEDLRILIFHKARLPKQRVVSYSFSFIILCWIVFLYLFVLVLCFIFFLFLSLVV